MSLVPLFCFMFNWLFYSLIGITHQLVGVFLTLCFFQSINKHFFGDCLLFGPRVADYLFILDTHEEHETINGGVNEVKGPTLQLNDSSSSQKYYWVLRKIRIPLRRTMLVGDLLHKKNARNLELRYHIPLLILVCFPHIIIQMIDVNNE